MADFEMDMVGLRVICTLVAPGNLESPNTAAAALVVPNTVEGTVYSVNAKSGILVLMTQSGAERSSFKVLRLSFIESVALAPSADGKSKPGCPTAEQTLPGGVASYATLPTLQSDSTENLERKILSKKRVGEEARKYTGVEDEISICALEVLDQLSRIYPDARWDEERNCISVGSDIRVTGVPSWNKPKVKGPAGSEETVQRIQKALDSRRTN